MKPQTMKMPRYAHGGITALMPKLQKSKKGKKPLRYADGGSTSTQYISNVPQGGEEAYERLIGQAEELVAKSKDTPRYEGERLAGFTDLQKQGFEGIEDLGPNARTTEAGKLASTATQSALNTSYKPNTQFTPGAAPSKATAQKVGADKVTAKNVAASKVAAKTINARDVAAKKVSTDEFTDRGTAQQYMNPYMQNVVDIQKREAVRADDIARGSRNAAAVGQGAFGGSRQAIVEAEAARNLAQQQNDIQAQGSNLAYQQAMQQFNADQGRGLQAGLANQATGLQAGLANQSTDIAEGRANQDALLRAGLANQATGLQAGLANQDTSLRAGLANQATGLQAGVANQNADLQADVANQTAGLQRGNQNLEAQRLGEASRQFGSTLALQGDQAAIQGANTLNTAGNTAYNQGLTSAQSQVTAGGLQQENVQQGLNQAYQTFQDDLNRPYQGIGFMSDILRGSQGSTRAMYETPAAPSPMQTLAGLATTSAGLSKPNAFGARGGEVKSDAIGRGLARIAPDSVGRFASGGIIGFADGGDPAELKRLNDARLAREAAEAELLREARRAPALGGADAAAASGPYIAGTGLYTGRVAPPGAPAAAPAAAPEAPAAPKDDFKIADKKEEPPATGIGTPSGAQTVAVPAVGSGRAQTLAEMKAAMKEAGVDYDALEKEGLAGIERAGAIDKKAAEEDAAGLAALHAKQGQASLKREARLKEQGDKLAGDSLIRTGLAILTADPRRGWLAATAAGATVGFAEYTERKEKLDLSMDALLEAREQAEFAQGKDALVAKRAVRIAERDLERAKTGYSSALGLKRTETQEKVFGAYQQQFESQKNRDVQVGIANAQMANARNISDADNAARAQIYGAGGKGAGSAQDKYIDNIRQGADAIMKEGYDNNGKPWTRERAEVEAKRRIDALMAGTSAAPSANTSGWSATKN